MSRVFRANSKWAKIVTVAPPPQPTLPSPEDILEQARKEALQILDDAREEADQIRARALEDSGKVEEEARKRGFVTGYESGYKDAVEALERTLRAAEDALEAARASFNEMLKDAEPRMLALCLEVARKVAGEAVERDPETAFHMIRDGLAVLKDEKEFRLRVNPSLVKFFESARERLIKQYGTRSIDIVADESAGQGAIIESPAGFVDATVEEAIRNISLALAEAKIQRQEVCVQ